MVRPDPIAFLRDGTPQVLPSMLLCDFGNLEREIGALEDAGVRGFHLDVMDGEFVPNLTYGMPIVAAMRRLTDLPLDVHLMIAQPGRYVDAFCDAGADIITFHVEAEPEAGALLERIRGRGVAAGLALNPATELESITGWLGACDVALVMSVQAGFGGQAFQPAALERAAELRRLAGDSLSIEMDGGINTETIGSCAEAGAELLVVGSAIFNQQNYGTAVTRLTELATRPLTQG